MTAGFRAAATTVTAPGCNASATTVTAQCLNDQSVFHELVGVGLAFGDPSLHALYLAQGEVNTLGETLVQLRQLLLDGVDGLRLLGPLAKK